MEPEENKQPLEDIQPQKEETPRQKSALERMNEGLYSRASTVGQEVKRTPQYVRKAIPRISQGWNQGKEKVVAGAEQLANMKKKRTFIKRFILSAVIFFLVSIGIAVYVFLGGLNQVSPDNIIVSIDTSTSIPAGKQYDFTLLIKNTNNVELRDSDITVSYPAGTRNALAPSQELKREKRDLGLIKSNSEIKEDFSAILYGEKGTTKQIAVSIEYNVPGSDTPFVKESLLDVNIDASLVTLEVSMGNEFVTGQTVTTDVFISSNTDTVVENMVLIAEYPFGFSFDSASPSPSSEKNVWYIGSVSPTEKKKISVTGKVEGTANDERTIRFKLGVRGSAGGNSIGSLVTESVHTYSIKSPLLDLAIQLNGKESGDTLSNIGSTVSGVAIVTNNLDVSVENTTLEIYVPEGVIDESRIRPSNGGFYRSADRKIVWDQSGNSNLQSLTPGESVSLGFFIDTVPASQTGTSLKNPQYTLEGSVKGFTENDRGSMGEVSTQISRTVKINSKLALTSKMYYSNGPFTNTGPIPPKVNNRTTYTVTWSLTNNYNALTNTSVTATLPSYVEWQGATSPSNENISFNSITRKVTWDVGRLSEGVGLSSSPKEVSFQVGFVPSTSQIGSAPIIVQNPFAGARDDFTDQSVSASDDSLTTAIENDQLYFDGAGAVQG